MTATPKKPGLKFIKSGTLSRGFALAKLTASLGAKVASQAVGHAVDQLLKPTADSSGTDANSESGTTATTTARALLKEKRLKELLISQTQLLARELGQLKGTLMKAGQMLSMLGEHLLPPEANEILKTLQSDSPPLEWPAIEKILKKHLSPDQLATIRIEPSSAASASLGQVHRATRLADGRLLAMKIQYPGVDAAIDSDIRALRSILSMSRLIPGGKDYESLFTEVREMLRRELDYGLELKTTREFRDLLAADPRFVVPEPVAELSGSRILTTTYEEGLRVDSPEVLSLSQERRNRIAIAAFDLYLRELFVFRKMQTDPHFGNYRVRLARSADEPDQLILFDFGAIREIPLDFLGPYRDLGGAAFERNQADFETAALKMGLLEPTDSSARRQQLYDLCQLILEPFHAPENEVYDFGASDLPKRAILAGKKMVMDFKLRPPPRELVFLDRKMGGVFILMSTLKARFNPAPILRSYLSI